MNSASNKAACRAGGLPVWACALAALASAASAQPREQDGPRRNLVVAWRLSGQGQSQRQQAGVQSGQLIVDSQGRVVGRTRVGATSYQTESQSDSVQEVQVLNGGRAQLFVGRSVPYTSWQWAWSGAAGGATGGTLGSIGPTAGQSGRAGVQEGVQGGLQGGMQGGGAQGGAQASAQGGGQAPQGTGGTGYPLSVVPQTVWIDLGQGLTVRPRWPGGRAPVTVELEARVRQPVPGGPGYGVGSGAFEPDGQTRRFEAGSTLTVPLGEWVVVARSGAQSQQQRTGTWSTRDVDESQSEQLEIRVTAP